MGDVFHIEFFAENDSASCAAAKADHLYSFDVPDADGGGLAVNLRGNVHFANGMCYFSGFFMNEAVMGMHQGWVETYFRPLDKVDVITSGRFCAASSGGRKPTVTAPAPKAAATDGQMTAGFLRETCGELAPGRPTVPAALCASYLRGVLEGAQLQAVASKMPSAWCFPRSATIMDAGQTYVRWYDREGPSPDDLGSISFGLAMVDAYPCSGTP